MRFKKLLFKRVFAAAALGFFAQGLIGCTDAFESGGSKDEHLIGNKLQAITELRADDGSQTQTVVLFDERLRKIHQFDLGEMKKSRTLSVRNPEEKHYVLHASSANYIVDLTVKGLTIFDKSGYAQNDPIVMQGTPKSAAFNPGLGYLVVYDNLMSVGILKLNPDGVILKKNVFGPIFAGGATINSGDLMNSGELVLALSDGKLARVDVEASLTQGHWVYTTVQTEFSSGLSWVAPVTGQNTKIMGKYEGGIALVNLTNGSTIAKVAVDTPLVHRSTTIESYKLSRAVDSHVVLTNYRGDMELIYTDGATLKTKTLYNQYGKIMNSQLDLLSDRWTLTTSTGGFYFDPTDGDINLTKSARRLSQFRASDLLAVTSVSVPNSVQAMLALNYFFMLYPSDLGYAVKQDMATGATFEMKGFNVKSYEGRH